MRTLNYLAYLLIVIGAINWGMIGFFGVDLVAMLFGTASMLSRIVYGLVGIAGLYGFTLFGLIGHEHHD